MAVQTNSFCGQTDPPAPGSILVPEDKLAMPYHRFEVQRRTISCSVCRIRKVRCMETTVPDILIDELFKINLFVR